MPWLRYLVAFVVACHGFTYIPFGLVVPRQLKEWKGTSRLLGPVLSADTTRAAVPVIHVVAGVAILACAIAIAAAPLAPGWWRPLAILGSVAGIAGFAAFWDGQHRYVVQEGGIGLGVSLILLIGALAFPGAFS